MPLLLRSGALYDMDPSSTVSNDQNGEGIMALNANLPDKIEIVNLEEVEIWLNEIKTDFQRKLLHQDKQIDKLRTEIENLMHLRTEVNDLKFESFNITQRIEFMKHLTKMNCRRCDDNEQFSRKINLRLEGIEVRDGDSPEVLMNYIIQEIAKLNLNINDIEFDRCHRMGKKYVVRNKTYQSTLIKLSFWKTRDVIYRNRKDLPFKVFADLTTRREDLLQFANEQLNDEIINDLVKFVYADRNCKLKLCSTGGRFYGFSSKMEFLNVVSNLHKRTYSTEIMLADELSDELYY